MALTNIKYMLWAQDMERAVSFYQNTIGLNVDIQSPEWSELKYRETIVALHGGHDGSDNMTGLSLQFDDVQSAYDSAVKNGAEPVHPPSQEGGEPIILATIKDPEGNIIMLTQFVG